MKLHCRWALCKLGYCYGVSNLRNTLQGTDAGEMPRRIVGHKGDSIGTRAWESLVLCVFGL